MQNDVVANAHRRDEVIANINTLIDRARTGRVPVIWVQHGDEGLRENTDDSSTCGMPPAGKVFAHTNMYWSQQAAPGARPGWSRPQT